MNTLLVRLKDKSKQQGLTQEQLAQKLNVSVFTVSRWFNGHNEPKSNVMKKALQAFLAE